jgi:stage II sporulation protein M
VSGLSFIGRFREGVFDYFRKNVALYFFVILLFALGVVAGSLTIKALGPDQKRELIDHLQVFLRGLGHTGQTVDPQEVMRRADGVHLKTAVLVWVLGVTIIGLPAVVAVIFVKGFVIGFSVGFLIEQMGLSGLVFSIFAIWPQNLVAVPAFLVIAASSISFSWLLLMNRLAHRKTPWFEEFSAYTVRCLAMTALLMVAGMLEGYLTPVLMRLVSQVLG